MRGVGGEKCAENSRGGDKGFTFYVTPHWMSDGTTSLFPPEYSTYRDIGTPMIFLYAGARQARSIYRRDKSYSSWAHRLKLSILVRI